MTELELLAPARNADIGIAAIDCGADAVYIAGPAFGARQDAGNSMEDIHRLCEYAHKFGVRIFLTLNTILYDSEIPDARRILEEAAEAGVDAVIAQDLALLCEKLIREAGVDGVYFCVQGAEKNRFTTEEYQRLVAPSDIYVLEHANRFSDNNILHCCGWAGESNNLQVWKDYPVKCVNWAVYVEKLPIPEGRIFYGDKAVLGGFETLHLNPEMTRYKGLLYSGSKEEIQSYTRELIQFCGKRGLLLGGDCTVASFVDHERIRWVVEAARAI